jgi:hypothetical protein
MKTVLNKLGSEMAVLFAEAPIRHPLPEDMSLILSYIDAQMEDVTPYDTVCLALDDSQEFDVTP